MELTLMQRILKITNELKVKKNGKNTFSKYDYFKLEDITDALNPLLEKYSVLLHYTLEQKEAGESFRGTLTLFDAGNPEVKLQYILDGNKADVKGASGIQMSGATITYGKRQSIMNAFNLSEDDDPDNNENDSKNPKNTPKAPTAPKTTGTDATTGILDTFKPFKVTQEDFERKYGKSMSEFTETDFAEIRTLYSDLKKQKKTKEEIFA